MAPGGIEARGLRVEAESTRGTAGGHGGFEVCQGRGGPVVPFTTSLFGALGELLGEGREAQGLESIPGLGLVHARIGKVPRMQGEFQVRHHCDQAFREVQPFGGSLQPLPLLGFQISLGGKDAFQAAELLQQQRGAFFADARHALHVVGGVPDQAQEVHHLLGPYAHAGHHTRTIVPDLAFLRVQHLDVQVIVHQLKQVLVRTDDDRRQAHGRGFPGQGAQDIVRLVAVQLHDGNVQRLYQLADHGNLGPQVLGHFRPVGLVVGIKLMAEGGLWRVEHAGEVRGFVLLQQLQHQPGEGIGRPVLQPRIGKVGPKDEGKGIDQIKAVLSHPPPPRPTARPRVSAQPIPRR